MSEFNTTITVEDLAGLAQVHMADFEWGSTAWVKSVPYGANGAVYVLLKSTTFAFNGTTVIGAISGSPIAGNAGSAWVFLTQPSTNPTGQLGFVYVRPIDGVTDDWPSLSAILTANAYQNIVVLMPGFNGERFQADTPLNVPAGSTIWGTAGTIIEANLPGPQSIQDCVFTMIATQGNAIPLVTNNVIGSRVIRLSADPGVGTYLQCQVGPAHLSGSTYLVVSVTPVGPNFDVTLDRPVLTQLLAANAAIIVATNVPMNIRIWGNGMTIRGKASNYVELQGAIRCYIDGITLDGATGPGTFAGACISADAMGARCWISNLTMIGDGGVTPGQVGLASFAESIYTSNVLARYLTTGIVIEGVGSSVENFLSYSNVVGVQITADGGAVAYPSESITLRNGIVFGCSSNGIVVLQGSNRISIVAVISEYNAGSGIFLQNIFTPAVVNSVSIQGGSYIGNGSVGIVDSVGVKSVYLTDVDVSDNQTGISVSGEMFATGLTSRSGNPTSVVLVNDGAEFTVDQFDLTMATIGSQAIQTAGTALLRASNGHLYLTASGSGFELGGTSKSFLSRMKFSISAASTLFNLNGIAGLVACIDHVQVEGAGLGTSNGVDVAAGCTARIGERVDVGACLTPFNFNAGSFWSRSIDSLAPNTFVTIGGGGAAVAVPWPDIEDSDRVTLQRVGPAPPPAGISMPTVTKILGTSFTVTPVGVADAGSVYAYTIE